MTPMHGSTMVGVVLVGYVGGALPIGVLVARRYGVDIRRHGSGNVGFTNVLRVLGWKPGLLVFLLDVAKGAGPVWLARRVCCSDTSGGRGAAVLAAVALATIIGHSFSVFLRFGGGKGVSTTLGAGLGVHAPTAALAFVVWLIVLAAWRYVSLGSVIAVGAVPVLLILFGQPREFVIWGVVIAVLCTFRHRDNIGRLLRGEERKFGRREKTPVENAGRAAAADQPNGSSE